MRQHTMYEMINEMRPLPLPERGRQAFQHSARQLVNFISTISDATLIPSHFSELNARPRPLPFNNEVQHANIGHHVHPSSPSGSLLHPLQQADYRYQRRTRCATGRVLRARLWSWKHHLEDVDLGPGHPNVRHHCRICNMPTGRLLPGASHALGPRALLHYPGQSSHDPRQQ